METELNKMTITVSLRHYRCLTYNNIKNKIIIEKVKIERIIS